MKKFLQSPNPCGGHSGGDPVALPTDLGRVQTEKDTVHISWTATSPEVDVEFSTGDGWTEIYSGDASQYDHSPVAAGTTYTYRVRGRNGDDVSDWVEGEALLVTYVYGYPTFGSVEKSGEPIMQLLFDREGHGNLVDEQNGIVFVPAQDFTVFYDAYEQAIGGMHAGVSPGIRLRNDLLTSGTSRARFVMAADEANTHDIEGTDDAVFEWWTKPESGQSTSAYHFSVVPGATYPEFTAQGILVHHAASNTSINVWLRATDDTLVQTAFTVPDSIGAEAPVYYRIVINRDDDTVKLFYKIGAGALTQAGSGSISALAGKTIPIGRVIMNGQYNGGAVEAFTTLYEWRFSKNLANVSV